MCAEFVRVSRKPLRKTINSHLKNMKKICSILVIAAAAMSVFAEVKMPAIFSNNMVFQQGKPINIWGTAKPNSLVKAYFNFKFTETKADKNGKWEMSLPAEKASYKNYALTMFEDGFPSKKISNILVGEVWIAGGQSNMEFRVNRSCDFEKAKVSADKLYGKLRYFLQSSAGFSRVPKTEFQPGAKWIEVDGKNVELMSAVSFYFAEKLIPALDVPVAIVYSSKGAASMETWSERGKILQTPWGKKEFAQAFKDLDAYDQAKYKKLLAAHKKKMADRAALIAKCKAENKPVPKVRWDFSIPPNDQSPQYDYKTPSLHFNGKIVPLGHFAVRGVIWYQGEGNAGGEKVGHFSDSFRVLIESWRDSLGDADLPFLQVQLASYGTTSQWPRARQAQYENTKLFKNVYMAPICDTGQKDDIHPVQKTIPGQRLADIALAKIYGKNICADAPVLKAVSYDGDTATVKFQTFDGPLAVKGKPRGFETLSNGKWAPANVSVNGGDVLVKSADGSEIRGVRYAWKCWNAPEVCLFGNNGFPALPFESLK